MTLNVSKIPQQGGGKKFEDPAALDPGTYPARVVNVIGLGLQLQQAFKGEPKPPAQKLMTTYEFVDEFLKDEGGEDDTSKPRWLSEDFPLFSLESDLATSTKRYLAIDPTKKFGGDWGQVAGQPCMVTLVQNAGKGKNEGRIFNNISSVQTMRLKEQGNCPELVNPPKVFDFYEPNLDVFLSLNSYVQGLIKEGLDFEGSKLQALIKAHEGGSAGVGAKDTEKATEGASQDVSDSTVDEEVDW